MVINPDDLKKPKFDPSEFVQQIWHYKADSRTDNSEPAGASAGNIRKLYYRVPPFVDEYFEPAREGKPTTRMGELAERLASQMKPIDERFVKLATLLHLAEISESKYIKNCASGKMGINNALSTWIIEREIKKLYANITAELLFLRLDEGHEIAKATSVFSEPHKQAGRGNEKEAVEATATEIFNGFKEFIEPIVDKAAIDCGVKPLSKGAGIS